MVFWVYVLTLFATYVLARKWEREGRSPPRKCHLIKRIPFFSSALFQ
jgi:hypothetical protein